MTSVEHPNLILVCLTRSSALLIGDSILSIVRNAARLAVYDEIDRSVNSHQRAATICVETVLKGVLNVVAVFL